MIGKFKSIIQLLDFFKDEETCKKYLAQNRWNGKITCPHCNHDKVYITKVGYKCASSDCYKKFSVTVGTIFENTKVPLRIWFAAIYLGTAHKKGISSLQLSRDLNITQKTAWFVLHRLRAMLKTETPFMLDNPIEVDEAYIGGKEKNRHQSAYAKAKRKAAILNRTGHDKSLVIGAVQRGGNVYCINVDDVPTQSFSKFVELNVPEGATVYTDEHTGYKKLRRLGFQHEFVTHVAGEYVRGNMHTNTIEGFWSLLKRGIIGIYHQVSVKHLNRYCDEFSYRYNTRKLTDGNRFEDAIKNTKKARLKYTDLIKN